MKRQNSANTLFLLVIFLLPWQTVFIYRILSLPEGITEYGRLVIYTTEFLMGLAFLLRGKPILSRDMLKIVQGLFLCMCVIFFSMTFSSFAVIAAGMILHLLVACLLFLFLCDERTKLDSVLKAFLLGLIAPCVLGWSQYLTGFSPAMKYLGLAEKHVDTAGVAVVATNTFRSLRAYGSFPHPNIFGGYLAVGILLLAWFAQSAKSIKQSIPFVCLLVLFTSTFILTFSRSAWLALTIATLLIFAFRYLKNHESRTISLPSPAKGKYDGVSRFIPRSTVPFLVCGLFTILLTVGILQSHVLARFNPSLHVEATSITERIAQYKTFPNVFAINPMLGVGPGSYIFGLESTMKGQPSYVYQPIHNTFLLILAELGIVGFGAFVFWMTQIGKWIWFFRKSIGGTFAIGLASIVCVIGLFDHYLFSMWCGLALSAFVLAVIVRIAASTFVHGNSKESK